MANTAAEEHAAELEQGPEAAIGDDPLAVMYAMQEHCNYALTAADFNMVRVKKQTCHAELTAEGDISIPYIDGYSARLTMVEEYRWKLDSLVPAAEGCASVEIDEHVLPTHKVAAEGRFDLRDRLVCGQDLDHGFAGWDGSATLSDPDWPFDLELSSPEARFFQLYSPSSGGIFVAEPVSHANAALNAPERDWDELGMRVLDPGEAMSLDMRLEVTAK